MFNPLSEQDYKERRIKKDFGVRGDYFRDQTAIIHSMAFRRLKNKTQVFFAPENDHVCTRIEHVLHVATIAATICKGLNQSNDKWNLDIDLAYAIGLGHDIGHAPFGHAGEDAINEKFPDQHFCHEINSYRVVEYLANNGAGLNLTFAVKDGILCHNGEKFEQQLKPNKIKNNLDYIIDRKSLPNSYEGCIVRMSDKIAYLGRDIEDAIRAGFIKKEDIPKEIANELGSKNGEIIDTFVEDIINNSKNDEYIKLSDEKYKLMCTLSKFNYDNIYNNYKILQYKKMCKKIIISLIDYLIVLCDKNGSDYSLYENSDIELDKKFGRYLKKMETFYRKEKTGNNITAKDYVAGMTDLYALNCISQINIPEPIKFEN